MSYFLTLINPQLLNALILAATITTSTYIVTKTTAVVFNKYHLWTNSANSVMMFWEWIKYTLNIDKALSKITKTLPKLKTKQKIRCNSCNEYYIQVNRGRHSRVETKRSHSPNLLSYLICFTTANDTGHQARFDTDYFII